jgi:prevent-host-death family protein
MYHIPVSDFKNEIAETLNRVAYSGERVLLQRHGKDVAALVSMKELHILEDLERIEDEQDENEAAIVLNSIKSGKSKVIPWEDAKKKLGI